MIIIRKPKSMRSDLAMRDYLVLAEAYAILASNTDDKDKRYEYVCKTEQFFKRAAKVGGFFRIKDMTRWLDAQKKEA